MPDNGNTQPTIFAVIDSKYMLPLDVAVEVVRGLAQAQRVTTTYSTNTPFKLGDSGEPCSLKVLTVAQHMAILLTQDKKEQS